MELKQVHRVIKFTQSYYMKVWVDYCTSKRSSSKSEFEKQFWKLLVNAVYGKTIENVFDRDVTKICRTKEQLLQHVSRSNYKRHVIINSELVIVSLKQTYVFFNKPFYIGFSILDISKTLMYDMYFLVLKKYYEKDVSLIYSDTDSFIIKVFNRYKRFLGLNICSHLF